MAGGIGAVCSRFVLNSVAGMRQMPAFKFSSSHRMVMMLRWRCPNSSDSITKSLNS